MTLDELKLVCEYENLTPRALAILLFLAKNGKTRNKEIKRAEELREFVFSGPAVSRAFDSLCISKLLVRERCDKDRRDVFGILTAEGRELAERISG